MMRDEKIARLMGAVSLVLILGALGFQYLGHIAPCEMCHWQRWPHIASAMIGLAVARVWTRDPRILAVLTVLLVAASGLIGAYQAGMQAGWLPGPDACSVAHPYVMGSGAPPPEVSCTAVTWSLLGLSLAAYNAIISLAAAALGALLLWRKP